MNHEPVPAPKVKTAYLVLKFDCRYFGNGTPVNPEYRIVEVHGKNEGEMIRGFLS